MGERGVRSIPGGIDWVCMPGTDGSTWRRQVRSERSSTNSQISGFYISPQNSQPRPPCLLLLSSSLHSFPRTPSFSVLLYNLILPPQRSFGHENLILCVLLGSLEIALQGGLQKPKLFMPTSQKKKKKKNIKREEEISVT